MTVLTAIKPDAALDRLRGFVTSFGELTACVRSEVEIIEAGGALLEGLIARDDWLPEAFAQPDPEHYRQYLLYRDPRARFSVISFVWGPGQSTPVHDHRTWGLIGVLRGAERIQQYRRDPAGVPRPLGSPKLLRAGAVLGFGPRSGDIHALSNGADDATSVSIHVYGADIGKVQRATYAADGTSQPFVSGYANAAPIDLFGPGPA